MILYIRAIREIRCRKREPLKTLPSGRAAGSDGENTEMREELATKPFDKAPFDCAQDKQDKLNMINIKTRIREIRCEEKLVKIREIRGWNLL